jgi:nicotinamide phosphoribosyltransferase
MEQNTLLLTDSYKIAHPWMFPEGTEEDLNYLEARSGALFNTTMLFGLQALIMEYFVGRVVTEERIKEAKEICAIHFGRPDLFPEEAFKYIIEKHDGRLPLEIRAVEEGIPVSVNNVMLTVKTIDPKLYFLAGYFESLISHVWAPSTVGTLSREVKLLCAHYLKQTSNNMAHLDFMLHDFGFRGVTSVESACSCGAGHIINFNGTDTLAAFPFIKRYYDGGVCAFSVPATQHSIMTAMGRNGEEEIFGYLLDRFPEGILAVVIDSYNYVDFIKVIANKYKDKILKRNGKIVFRPDSGEPIATSAHVLDLLQSVFGVKDNEKGYKVLNPKVGTLWGDGLSYLKIRDILHNMKSNKWSAENIVFGMGGGLLQSSTRDTQRIAMKSCQQVRNGVKYPIFKEPLDISKVSKKGEQYLYRVYGSNGASYITTDKEVPGGENMLKQVFYNGSMTKYITFDQIRKNAQI